MCVIAVMPPALPRSAFTSGDWGKMAVNFPSGEENSVQSDCAGAPLETNTRRGMTAAANQWECRMEDSFTLYLTIQVRVLTAGPSHSYHWRHTSQSVVLSLRLGSPALVIAQATTCLQLLR